MNDQKNQPVPVTVHGARVGGVSRREAMQWVIGAMAATAFDAPAQAVPTAKEVGRQVAPQEVAALQPPPTFDGKGYGTDPKLVKTYKPGEVWPLTFTDAQKRTATALADLIIPADDLGPAASEVGVVAMVDEWVSAPYPQQQGDRPVILKGLDWIDAESMKRFGKSFADSSDANRRAIADDICFTGGAPEELRQASEFFSRFRSLCAAAYYATPPGWKALGYVGNTPLVSFDGPPREVLERLAVEQTVR